tara:strand:+ start:4168 stop:4755 length:588 start_codon:yes stop_codon:yes gene_type:complete
VETKLEKAIALIDKKNNDDPNIEVFEGKSYPKELLYSMRMTAKLLTVRPQASEALQIAIRAQHICRWEIPRKKYPMDRIGYFKWRNDLKKMHAEITSNLLEGLSYEKALIDRVAFLINKKLIKRDPEIQLLEDIVCLVFLEYYFEAFMVKHTDEKIIDILRKTWVKMSDEGQELALKLNLSEDGQNLVKKALEKN